MNYWNLIFCVELLSIIGLLSILIWKKRKTNKEKECDKPNEKKILLRNNWIVVGIIIILIGFDFYCHIPAIDMNYVGMILAFVGILATFVVIGNYAQVLNVKSEFETKVNEQREIFERKIEAQDDKVNKKVIELDNKIKQLNYDFSFNAFTNYCMIKRYDMALPIGLDVLLATPSEKIEDMKQKIVLPLKDKKIALFKTIRVLCESKINQIISKFSAINSEELREIIDATTIRTKNK